MSVQTKEPKKEPRQAKLAEARYKEKRRGRRMNSRVPVRLEWDLHTGKRIKEAPPSFPAVVTGLADVAPAGTLFQVLATERAASGQLESRPQPTRGRLAGPSSRSVPPLCSSQLSR